MARKVQLIIDVKDADFDRASQSARRMKRAVDDLADGGARVGSSLSTARVAAGAFIGSLGTAAVTAITQKFMEGAAALLQYKSSLQQTEIGFTTLLGSGDRAKKLLLDIQNFAKSTPFEFQGIAQLSQRLLGANVEASKIIPLMTDIGNVVAATGETSQERLEGVTVALVQMISKQKVSAEEMEQLAERGVNGFDLLSKATGRTQADLRKMAEEGKISSEVMLSALQKVSRERFGDAMERQSRTFAGSMSNIRDSLFQVASNAFQPLYDRIGNLAYRFSQDIGKQGNDFKGVGNVIAQYIGEGLGLGLGAIIDSLGKYLGSRLSGIFTKGEIIDPITKNLFGGFFSALGEGLGIIEPGKIAEPIKRDLQDVNGAVQSLTPIGDVLKAAEAKQQTAELSEIVKDLTTKIQFFGQQSEVAATKQKLLAKNIDLRAPLARNALALASQIDRLKASQKEYETLAGVVRNLSLQVIFFGDESQVAATKQQLLSQGITNMNSALAQQSLLWAQELDRLKAAKTAQDDYNQQLKGASDYLDDLAQSADFEFRFPEATQLQQLEEWVLRQGKNFDSLNSKIELTRATLQKVATKKNVQNLMDLNRSGMQQLTEFIQGLNGTKGPLDEALQNVSSGLGLNGLKDNNGVDVTMSAFSSQIQGFVNAYREALKVLDVDTSVGALGKIREAWKGFLTTFQNAEGFAIIGDKTEADQWIQTFLKLADAIDLANKKATDEAGKDFIADLNEEIAQLNVQLGISAELSKRDAAAKQLQTEAYAGLDPKIRDAILAKAQEIDTLKASVRAQEEYQRAFDQTAGMFEDILSNIADRNWSGLFDSIIGEMRRFLIRAAAEWLTSKFFKLLTGQSSGSGGGSQIPGLGGIFGGGGGGGGGIFGGGQTPSWNPNIPLQLPGSGSGGGGISLPSGISIPTASPGRANAGGGGGFFGGGTSGTIGGIAAVATIAGGIIGGRWGNTISLAGTGAMLGLQFGGPVGAAIGAAIGAGAGILMGILGGDPKRKRDKKEKMPQLNKGFADAFAEMQQLIEDVRFFRTDPDQALTKARELRAAIAGGFGVQFESKKYKRESRSAIERKLAEFDKEPDGLYDQLKKAVEIAKGAADRNKRILPEFAAGVFLRPNGLLPGRFDGRDDLLALLSRGEMVLNPGQQARARAAAGFDVFASAGVPNYPSAAASPKLATGGIAGAGITVQPSFNLILEGVSFTESARAWIESDDGKRTMIRVNKKLKKTGDI
ncbi:MAG: tape measure protein [Acidobacteria bacterium]|nr:tape measure protein [Acidobacteriota bacterium]